MSCDAAIRRTVPATDGQFGLLLFPLAAGLTPAPEGRQISPNLTTRDKFLVAAAANRRQAVDPWNWTRLVALFPLFPSFQHGQSSLRRRAQTRAVGRALMTNPRLLILDEATEGLAPPLPRRDFWRCLSQLKGAGRGGWRPTRMTRGLTEHGRPALHDRTGAGGLGASFLALMAAVPDIQHRYLGI